MLRARNVGETVEHLEDLVPDPRLIAGIDALFLDAGNTVIFLDHGAVSAALAARDLHVRPEAIERAEGETKRRMSHRSADLAPALDRADIPRSWGRYFRTLLEAAGVPATRSADVVASLWPEHAAFNFWRAVPADLPTPLRALRARGVPVVVVSNSEGRLPGLFERLGIGDCFDAVVDSHDVGFEKPDPRIFEVALRIANVTPDRALHLGDTVATDIEGARAAGVRCALVDVFGHYEGLLEDVPRVPSAAAVARALLAART